MKSTNKTLRHITKTMENLDISINAALAINEIVIKNLKKEKRKLNVLFKTVLKELCKEQQKRSS